MSSTRGQRSLKLSLKIEKADLTESLKIIIAVPLKKPKYFFHQLLVSSLKYLQFTDDRRRLVL